MSMLSNSEIGSGGGVRRIAAPYLHYIRLAGFPIGLGLTSVLVSGTLNRVMIAELDLPASLVGLFLAIPLLISPARVWLGYRSDTYPLWGLRREPYIIFGSLVAVLGLTGATIASLNIDSATGLMIGATLLAFTVYGLGKNLSSNTFEALLADKFEGDQRPKAVTFFKIAMFMGIMVGAIALGKFSDIGFSADQPGNLPTGTAHCPQPRCYPKGTRSLLFGSNKDPRMERSTSSAILHHAYAHRGRHAGPGRALRALWRAGVRHVSR
jgi:hypothetical protein